MNESQRQEVVDLLRALVACPSVNPGERTEFAPPFGEAQLAELLKPRLESLGAKVTLTEVAPKRPNLIATFTGRDASRSLMLDAHLDTVPVEGMTIPPFAPTVKHGLLYGRGACDTKGPMTAILLALQRVLDEDGALPVTVHFVAGMNEEHGGTGAMALMESGFRADAAIIGEPTEMAIIHAHKGSVRWRLTTHGKAAHSSRPELGVNAIVHMARVIDLISGEMTARLTGIEHPVIGHPTLSVGKIGGGTQVNVVPDECWIDIDRRMVPGEDRVALGEELIATMDGLKNEISDLTVSIKETEHYPPLEIAPESPVVKALASACESVLGEARFEAATFGTNGGFYSKAGIPSVVFGPGSLKQAHQAVEFIEIDAVCRAVDVYAEAIRAFARGE